MAQHEVISTCPVCSGELAVTRLRCPECGTTIEGEFAVRRFARLSGDQLGLLESFLRARGNLRELERELGVSYPTVRARLDGLLRTLGIHERTGGTGQGEAAESSGDDVPPPDEAGADEATVALPSLEGDRRQILGRLARHEIDAATAAAAIRDLRRRPR